MANFIVFVYSQNCTGRAGKLVRDGKAQELLQEVAEGGDIGADHVMYEFESVVDALEYGHNELLLNIVTADKYRRTVGLSIMEAASEAGGHSLVANLKSARKVLEDRK